MIKTPLPHEVIDEICKEFPRSIQKFATSLKNVKRPMKYLDSLDPCLFEDNQGTILALQCVPDKTTNEKDRAAAILGYKLSFWFNENNASARSYMTYAYSFMEKKIANSTHPDQRAYLKEKGILDYLQMNLSQLASTSFTLQCARAVLELSEPTTPELKVLHLHLDQLAK